MLTSNIAGVENGVNKETKFHYKTCVSLLCLLVTRKSTDLLIAKYQYLITLSQANRNGILVQCCVTWDCLFTLCSHGLPALSLPLPQWITKNINT